MTAQVVSKDAWLVQAIGGTAKYGNGDGERILIGRVPSGAATPDWKSRGVFEIELRNDAGTGLLDGKSAIGTAEFEMTVAPSDCLIDGRGGNFYALLEEISGDFTEKPAGGNCNFGLGTGTGVWGADSGATTANRAFVSESGLATGDKVTWNIATKAAEWLADPAKTVARFRVIFANSAGTAYDEAATAPRGTAFYSLEDATSGNRPVVTITGSSSAVAKTSSDSITLIEEPSDVAASGGPNVTNTESITFTESAVAGPIPTWFTEDGRGKVVIPSSPGLSTALLPDIDEEDVLIACRFSIDKIPQNQNSYFYIIARVQDSQTYYWLAAACSSFGGDAGITLYVSKIVSGTVTFLGQISSLRALLPDTDYFLKFLLFGTSPTTLGGKLWRDGEVEPSGYQITGQDSEAALQSSGSIGLRVSSGAVRNLPITFTFDDFVASIP